MSPSGAIGISSIGHLDAFVASQISLMAGNGFLRDLCELKASLSIGFFMPYLEGCSMESE